MTDEPLDEFLGNLAAAGPDGAFKERQQRKQEQARLKRRLLLNRIGAVMFISTGAATAVGIACCYTGVETSTLIRRTLGVFFGGPILGLVAGAYLLMRVLIGEERDRRRNRQLTEDDFVIDSTNIWIWMRFIIFAGPIGAAALAFSGDGTVIFESCLGVMVGASVWQRICIWRDEPAPFG